MVYLTTISNADITPLVFYDLMTTVTFNHQSPEQTLFSLISLFYCHVHSSASVG